MLVNSPVVMDDPTTRRAPNHEMSSMQPYTLSCMSGALKAMVFSALRKSS